MSEENEKPDAGDALLIRKLREKLSIALSEFKKRSQFDDADQKMLTIYQTCIPEIINLNENRLVADADYRMEILVAANVLKSKDLAINLAPKSEGRDELVKVWETISEGTPIDKNGFEALIRRIKFEERGNLHTKDIFQLQQRMEKTLRAYPYHLKLKTDAKIIKNTRTMKFDFSEKENPSFNLSSLLKPSVIIGGSYLTIGAGVALAYCINSLFPPSPELSTNTPIEQVSFSKAPPYTFNLLDDTIAQLDGQSSLEPYQVGHYEAVTIALDNALNVSQNKVITEMNKTVLVDQMNYLNALPFKEQAPVWGKLLCDATRAPETPMRMAYLLNYCAYTDDINFLVGYNQVMTLSQLLHEGKELSGGNLEIKKWSKPQLDKLQLLIINMQEAMNTDPNKGFAR